MTGVSMRIVPASDPFKLQLIRPTKPGRSVGPACGSHCTARPSAPAMDVNVPHSCATSLDGAGRDCPDTNTDANSNVATTPTGLLIYPPAHWSVGCLLVV